MTKGNGLFLRMDYRNEDIKWNEQILQNHLAWAKRLADERFFIGGGIENIATKDGPPACLFEAKDLKEAEDIINMDPLIENGLYRYELHKWNMVIFSNSIFE